jgi:electron transport complex protein RnfB
MAAEKNNLTRRGFLRDSLWGASLASIGAVTALGFRKVQEQDMLWQIDPQKCIACGNCATYCVLEESAVKCTHAFEICGYCEVCFGFFEPESVALHEGAENQMCPTGALLRKFIEEPYYQYTIDEHLCNACGKCVKGCNAFGNGSLHLQIHHDRCLNCNECAIAAACPSGAIIRVPADKPYIKKGYHT